MSGSMLPRCLMLATALCFALSGTGLAQESSPLSLQLSAGLGVGTRAVDLPLDGAIEQTRTGLFPAFGIGLDLDYALSSAVTTGLLVRYQSSLLGHAIVEQHVDGSERPMDLRSHRLELALSPVFHLDTPKRWAVAASLGYATRNLRPEVNHLVTPSYSLTGPHLRAELRAVLWRDLLRLRVGPEAHWIVHVGRELRDRGVHDSGLALGGEGGLELALSAHVALQLSYREMHSALDASGSESFADVTRFLMVHLVGSL